MEIFVTLCFLWAMWGLGYCIGRKDERKIKGVSR